MVRGTVCFARSRHNCYQLFHSITLFYLQQHHPEIDLDSWALLYTLTSAPPRQRMDDLQEVSATQSSETVARVVTHTFARNHTRRGSVPHIDKPPDHPKTRGAKAVVLGGEIVCHCQAEPSGFSSHVSSQSVGQDGFGPREHVRRV